jgi:hypothetical protein
MAYFSGQGRVYIGARDELGNPAGLTFVGNVPELKVSLSVDTIEHQEAQSGQRLTDLQLIKTKKGEFACTLEELIATNLALALYGTTTTITPGTVTGELLPNPVTPGSLYPLTMQNVSAVQIQDSDATPKTLPASQYSVNAKHGSLVVLDATSGGPYTEPFTVDYAYGGAEHSDVHPALARAMDSLRGAQHRRRQPRGGDRPLPRGHQPSEGTVDHHRRVAEVRAVGPGTGGSNQAGRW